MNLEFVPIEKIVINEKVYIRQRAIISNTSISVEFWKSWKTNQELQNNSNIQVSRELHNGRHLWTVYRTIPQDPINTPPITFSLSYKLKSIDNLLPYQPRAVAHICNALINKGAAIDASDTGLGKTYVSLAVSRELSLRPAIVCKIPGISGWYRACKFFGISPLFIVNWELAKSSKFPYVTKGYNKFDHSPMYKWMIPTETLLIFDEAHEAVNEGTLNYALYTASKGLTSISCTATMADRPSRLQSYFHILGIKHEREFTEWMKAQGYFVNQNKKLEGLNESQDLAEFNKILFPNFGYRLSYNDKDVRDYFPEAVYQIEIVALSEEKRQEQNALYGELLAKAAQFQSMGIESRQKGKETGNRADLLVADLRYRQAAELFKAENLIELALQYLQDNKAVCIFVNFMETLKIISRALKTKSLIYGNQDKDGLNRDSIIDNFQSGKEKIIVSMVNAGGQSINLHDLIGIQRISLICPTYNAIKLQQVLGRTYRAGSKTPPIMKLVYAEGTIEEKVALNVQSKLRNIQTLNTGDLTEPGLFETGYEREE